MRHRPNRATSAAALAAAVLGGSLISLPTADHAQAQLADTEVLVWYGTYGFPHPSIPDAVLAFQELGLTTGAFNVRATNNPLELNATVLAETDVLVWLHSTGKPPFTDQQRDEIIRFAGCGGGTMAFHAAADSNYGWPEYAELLGAQFDSHPQNAGAGEARMVVEDNTHTITEGWAGVDEFQLDDEYYRWRAAQGLPGVSRPRTMDDVHVLLSLDETTVEDGIQDSVLRYEHRQPIAWTKTFRGAGRVYYNNMGHSSGTWGVDAFRTSLVNGIAWTSEVQLDADCYSSSEPLPEPAGPPAPDPSLRGTVCPVPAYDARTGPPWQTSEEIRALTEEGDERAMNAGLPGGLGWGAQLYVLDLSSTGADTATVQIDLAIPNPVDDYDLSVTTGWGWYGSQAGPGATSEALTLEDVPHCALLQVYADNMFATATQAPTLAMTVAPDPVESTPEPESAPAPTPEPAPEPETEPAANDLPVTGGALLFPAGLALLAAASLRRRD